jgi:hypothetical protein
MNTVWDEFRRSIISSFCAFRPKKIRLSLWVRDILKGLMPGYGYSGHRYVALAISSVFMADAAWSVSIDPTRGF